MLPCISKRVCMGIIVQIQKLKAKGNPSRNSTFLSKKIKRKKKDKYETYTHEDTNNTKKQHISEKKNYQNPTQNTNVRQREKERKKGNTTRCFD